MGQSSQIKATNQAKALAAFAGCGNAYQAAADAGIAMSTWWGWHRDDDFKARLEVARQTFAERLEALAWERVSSPTGNRGSDALLIFLLNGAKPAKYRPNVPMTASGAEELLKLVREFKEERQAASASAEASAESPTAVEAESWLEAKKGG